MQQTYSASFTDRLPWKIFKMAKPLVRIFAGTHCGMLVK